MLWNITNKMYILEDNIQFENLGTLLVWLLKIIKKIISTAIKTCNKDNVTFRDNASVRDNHC